MMEPIFPKPNYIESIWGGTRLSDLRGIDASQYKGNIGISREVCAYHGVENLVESGEYKGINLHKLIIEHHQELMGDDEANELIRLAYMDPIEDLSLQVHPNEEYAFTNENDHEKSESWYILECDPKAYIIAGTTIQDKKELLRAAKQNELEKYVKKISVRKGDSILIPAGLIHACGKNMLALEVGSYGGITYRMYDYGRGRSLNLEKGFDVLDPNLQCSIIHSTINNNSDKTSVTKAIRHSLFATDIIDISSEWFTEKGNTYCILAAVDGNAELIINDKTYYLPYTKTVIIPACIRKYGIRGRSRILLSYHTK